MSYFLRRLAGSRSVSFLFDGVSPSPTSSFWCRDTGVGISSSLSSLQLCSLGGLKSASRWVHSTSSRRGAASKLKESPVAVQDEIDPTKPADYNPSSFDPTEARSAPSEKILRIVDEIANLTLLEASDLSYLLKKKLGLPDSAMPYYGGMGPGMAMPQAGAPSPAVEEEKKPERTSFDVKLEKYEAASKIKVIKEVRAFTSLGLKEAKELVEKMPVIVKKGVNKEEAEQIIEKLKSVGATAVMD